MLFEPASPSSVLALVTTLHLGIAALRNHRNATRGPFSGLALIDLLLAATPWVFPSTWGLALGLTTHLAWFVACESLAAPAPAVRPATPARPETLGARAQSTPVAANRAPVAPKGFVQTPVVATLDETPDIRTIRLARPDGFEFEAGQFLPVRMRVDGHDYVRCYSISSSPDCTGYLEISVKRQGVVSNALHAVARPGAILSVKTPNGKFKYPAADDRPLVLLAGGVGITPLISMLRHAVHTEPSRRVTLCYSAHDERHLAFRDDLAVIARRHPQVHVVFALTRSATADASCYPGRIDAALLRATVPDIEHAISFICGPQPMIEAMKAVLASLGVPPAQVRHEVFEAAVAASANVRDRVPVGQAAAAGTSRGGRGGPAVASRCAMRCLPRDVTVSVQGGQTLLEAAEAGGVDMPSLCRAGVCGTCRVRVTDGDVQCDSTTLDAADVGQGYVLACVAQPQTDCTVQL